MSSDAAQPPLVCGGCGSKSRHLSDLRCLMNGSFRCPECEWDAKPDEWRKNDGSANNEDRKTGLDALFSNSSGSENRSVPDKSVQGRMGDVFAAEKVPDWVPEQHRTAWATLEQSPGLSSKELAESDSTISERVAESIRRWFKDWNLDDNEALARFQSRDVEDQAVIRWSVSRPERKPTDLGGDLGIKTSKINSVRSRNKSLIQRCREGKFLEPSRPPKEIFREIVSQDYEFTPAQEKVIGTYLSNFESYTDADQADVVVDVAGRLKITVRTVSRILNGFRASDDDPAPANIDWLYETLNQSSKDCVDAFVSDPSATKEDVEQRFGYSSGTVSTAWKYYRPLIQARREEERRRDEQQPRSQQVEKEKHQNNTTHPCEYCGKGFSNEKSRNGHYGSCERRKEVLAKDGEKESNEPDFEVGTDGTTRVAQTAEDVGSGTKVEQQSSTRAQRVKIAGAAVIGALVAWFVSNFDQIAQVLGTVIVS